VRGTLVAVGLLAGSALDLAAQVDLKARLEPRVPPTVVQAVEEIGASVAARGLPLEPLIQKAIEGSAKGVPEDRVIAAVRALATRLDAAAGALRSAGIERPVADVVEGGAYALGAGLSANQVSDLARSSPPPYGPALTLRVAATLAALGVPPATALDLVLEMMRAGRAPNEIIGLPAQVQAGTSRGATPAQAAQGLAPGAAHAPPGRPPDWVPPGQEKPPNPHKPDKPGKPHNPHRP
jgi:rhodanese-related sulfurtransferase